MMRPFFAVQFRRLSGLALLVALAVGVAAPAFTVEAAESISVERNDARSDFPAGVVFELEAVGERKIETVELLYSSANSETLSLAVPEFKAAKRVELSHELDLFVNYQPVGIDLNYRWRLVDDKGRSFETEPRTVLWEDSRFEWASLASNDVTVYAYNQNEAFNRRILDSAQETVDRLKVEYGVDEIEPIRIWAYNSKKDFSATQAPNSSHWIAGTAYPQYQVILAILPEGNKREVGRVVPHEISHQVLHQATRNPFNATPTWLDEGLAVVAQQGGNEDFPALVVNAGEQGRLFSIRALNSDFPYDPADASLAYAESYSIVTFIIDHFGEEKLTALIHAYRGGVSHEEALRSTLGVGIDELDRLWKESLDYPGDQGVAGGVRSEGESSGVSGLGELLASGALVLALAVAVALFASLVRRTRLPIDASAES